MTLTKTYDAHFKALDEKAGTFEALVSVFGNVDHIGDRVMPGAFTKSIEDWRAKGDPIPIIWSHQWNDPNAHIGSADPADVEQTAKGLLIKGQLDLDNPFAAQVYRLIKDRRVKEWSFAYDTIDEKRAKDGANNLNVLDIIEAGPTLKGMNAETETITVKARDAKAYLYLDGSMEALQDELLEACQAWAMQSGSPGWAWLEATFTDRVVFGVETYSAGTWDETYYEATYTVGDDGDPVLGDVTEVELSATTVPVTKGRSRKRRGSKAGRVLSAANESDLQSAHDLIGGVLAQVADDAAKTDEPSGVKADELRASVALFDAELASLL